MSSLFLELLLDGAANVNSVTITERALKRLRAVDFDSTPQHLHTRFLNLSSKVCEELFSIARYELTNGRNEILHEIMEMQLPLFVNCDFLGS